MKSSAHAGPHMPRAFVVSGHSVSNTALGDRRSPLCWSFVFMRPRPWRLLDIIETAFAILITVWIASIAIWATTRHTDAAQFAPRAVESARLP